MQKVPSLLLASAFLVSTAFADGLVQGDVKGVDGKPAKGADVRFELQGAKKPIAIVAKTDARGHFIASNLPDGKYNVVAIVTGGVRSTSQLVRAQSDRPVMLTFDLRPSSAVAGMHGKKKKKFVWVPDETGSHLGGRYVEVDDDSDSVPNAQHLDKASSAELRRYQSLNKGSGMGPTGH